MITEELKYCRICNFTYSMKYVSAVCCLVFKISTYYKECVYIEHII